jgi:tetratricopeptide (TPR) repeat protein
MTQTDNVAKLISHILKHDNTSNRVLAAKCIGNLENTKRPEIEQFMKLLEKQLYSGIVLFSRINLLLFILLAAIWLSGFPLLSYFLTKHLQFLYFRFFDIRIIIFSLYFFGVPGLFVQIQKILVRIFRRRATKHNILPAIMALRYADTTEARKILAGAGDHDFQTHTFRPPESLAHDEDFQPNIDDQLKVAVGQILKDAKIKEVENCEHLISALKANDDVEALAMADLLANRIDDECFDQMIKLAQSKDFRIRNLTIKALDIIGRTNKEFRRRIKEEIKTITVAEKFGFYVKYIFSYVHQPVAKALYFFYELIKLIPYILKMSLKLILLIGKFGLKILRFAFIRIKSSPSWPLRVMGWLYYKQTFYVNAIKWYKRATVFDTNNLYLNNIIGNCYYALGKTGEAVNWYKKAISLNPKAFWIYRNLGLAYSKQRNYNEAIASFNKSLMINPTFSVARTSITETQKAIEIEKTIEFYKNTLVYNPFDCWMYYDIGYAYQSLRDYEEAVAWYENALRIQPYFVEAMNAIGNAYYYAMKYQDAIHWYGKAIELDPRHFYAYRNIGMCFEAEGNYYEAKTWFQKAYQIDPSFNQTLLDLNRVSSELEGHKKLEDLSRAKGFTKYKNVLLSGIVALAFAVAGLFIPNDILTVTFLSQHSTLAFFITCFFIFSLFIFTRNKGNQTIFNGINWNVVLVGASANLLIIFLLQKLFKISYPMAFYSLLLLSISLTTFILAILVSRRQIAHGLITVMLELLLLIFSPYFRLSEFDLKLLALMSAIISAAIFGSHCGILLRIKLFGVRPEGRLPVEDFSDKNKLNKASTETRYSSGKVYANRQTWRKL